MRAPLVWLIATVVLLASLLLFVAFGWPGSPNGCTAESPNTCYCEAYDMADVEAGKPGVRQPVNTWFNLYSVFTSAIVVAFLSRDRKTFAGRTAPNLMRSDSWIADIYLFAVLFLGLGSMWFHASLTEWGGTFDGLSMYVFATFLVFYTAVRLWGRPLIFWIGYPTLVLMMTLFHAQHVSSLILILILVAAYLALEVTIWIRRGEWALGAVKTRLLWVFAGISIIAATVFWILSQTDMPLCSPESSFQAHGLLWHPLAGVMAVLLYFYWREEEPG